MQTLMISARDSTSVKGTANNFETNAIFIPSCVCDRWFTPLALIISVCMVGCTEPDAGGTPSPPASSGGDESSTDGSGSEDASGTSDDDEEEEEEEE